MCARCRKKEKGEEEETKNSRCFSVCTLTYPCNLGSYCWSQRFRKKQDA